MTSRAFRLGLAVAALVAIAALASPAHARARAAQGDRIGSLTAKGVTYHDVEVLLITDKDMHIRHRGGVARIALSDLVVDRGAATRSPTTPLPPAIENNVVLRTMIDTVPGAVADVLPEAFTAPLPDRGAVLRFLASFLLVILAVAFVLWVFFAYCNMLICRKAGHEPGVLIWFPILQSIPLLRAAGMSLGWLLVLYLALPLMQFWTAFLAPDTSGFVSLASFVFNLVYAVTWCVRIVRARGKHGVWAFLLLFPFTSLIAFLYLAFSE